MRTIWIASGVFLLGAFVCAVQRQDDLALVLAAIGFEIVFVAESNVDWRHRIELSTWRESLVERRWQVTLFGKLAQVLAFVCLFLWGVVTYR